MLVQLERRLRGDVVTGHIYVCAYAYIVCNPQACLLYIHIYIAYALILYIYFVCAYIFIYLFIHIVFSKLLGGRRHLWAVQAKLLVGSPYKGCSFQVPGATLAHTRIYDLHVCAKKCE